MATTSGPITATKTAQCDSGVAIPPVYDSSNPSQVPYPHLLNFFESQQSSHIGVSAQFHRLLYYLGVPSRFANVQMQMQAQLAGQSQANSPHWFHTPYNRISRYREPGMINLNTVTSSDVLFGAMNTYCQPIEENWQLNSAFWDKFVRSRRGDGAVPGGLVTTSTATLGTLQQSTSNMLTINPNVPSRFMRPYRTPGGAFLAPPNYQGGSAEPRRETDVTFLRADPDLYLTSGGTSDTIRPLYGMDDYLVYGMNSVQTPPTNTTPDQFPLAAMDYNRGPNFRYQLMQKLGSAASTHSNVFAIWITVGYFEVMPAPNGAGLRAPRRLAVGPGSGRRYGRRHPPPRLFHLRPLAARGLHPRPGHQLGQGVFAEEVHRVA